MSGSESNLMMRSPEPRLFSSRRSDCSRSRMGQSFPADRATAPDRNTQRIPLRSRRSSARSTPLGLLGNIGLMAAPSVTDFQSRLGSQHAGRLHRDLKIATCAPYARIR